ncbi:uncharacterized protein LOC122212373 [Panthera leo]|uniref:uncharacterized protein LOC122212373 n=1 Tax=Panthera leo TaxID=9689 RepID=UPI001C69FD83|nr:uncharacterized protein LOC122212373 [Panthera leo]
MFNSESFLSSLHRGCLSSCAAVDTGQQHSLDQASPHVAALGARREKAVWHCPPLGSSDLGLVAGVLENKGLLGQKGGANLGRGRIPRIAITPCKFKTKEKIRRLPSVQLNAKTNKAVKKTIREGYETNKTQRSRTSGRPRSRQRPKPRSCAARVSSRASFPAGPQHGCPQGCGSGRCRVVAFLTAPGVCALLLFPRPLQQTCLPRPFGSSPTRPSRGRTGTDQVSVLVPGKEELNIVKLYAHRGDAVTVYVSGGNPILFEVEKNLYPTVYALWSYPDLLPAFTTWPPVLEKLMGGADLMLPGLVVPPAGLPQVQKGDLCAIALLGNRSASSGTLSLLPCCVVMEEVLSEWTLWSPPVCLHHKQYLFFFLM